MQFKLCEWLFEVKSPFRAIATTSSQDRKSKKKGLLPPEEESSWFKHHLLPVGASQSTAPSEQGLQATSVL